MHSQIGLGQPYKARASLDTTCHTLYL
jgi:hypothetical protein